MLKHVNYHTLMQNTCSFNHNALHIYLYLFDLQQSDLTYSKLWTSFVSDMLNLQMKTKTLPFFLRNNVELLVQKLTFFSQKNIGTLDFNIQEDLMNP